jgi:hypothetical protein
VRLLGYHQRRTGPRKDRDVNIRICDLMTADEAHQLLETLLAAPEDTDELAPCLLEPPMMPRIPAAAVIRKP